MCFFKHHAGRIRTLSKYQHGPSIQNFAIADEALINGTVQKEAKMQTSMVARCLRFCEVTHKMHLDFVRATMPVYKNTTFWTAPDKPNLFKQSRITLSKGVDVGFKLKGGKKSEVIVVVIGSGSYKAQQMDVVKQVSKKFKRICYVNTNNTFDSLLEQFTKNKIDLDKFLFIDAVSKKPKEAVKNCIFTGSLHGLTDLSLTTKKVLRTKKFDALVFDSLSSLLNYHSVMQLTRFVHDLFEEVKKTGAVGVFTLPRGRSKDLLADVGMFADHVSEVK